MAGFAAFGDFGGGPAQGAVAAGMLRWVRDGHRVDALVTTGDNVYDFGEPKFFEAHLKAPYRALQANGRPMWATLGNHDVAARPRRRAAGLPRPAALPYAKTLPGVRFLFLDANRPGDDAQKQWLAEQLAAPAPPLFTVAVFHQPVFSCGLHGRTADGDRALVPDAQLGARSHWSSPVTTTSTSGSSPPRARRSSSPAAAAATSIR